MITKFAGRAGEDAAATYLKKRGYKIVERNFRTRLGEIDIIAKHKNVLVFVEVKARADLSFQRPAESVTADKQRKIALTALYFLSANGLDDVPCRFDVIEVVGKDVNHIINAFEYNN